MNRKMRELSTVNRMGHTKADVNTMNVPRLQRERGMINLEICFK